MLPGRLSLLPPGSFARLSTLLDAETPGGEIVNLSIGDPRGPVPPSSRRRSRATPISSANIRAINGTCDWREAAAAWLVAASDLPETAIHMDKHLLPLNGTREGLFLAPFVVTPEQKAGRRPVILVPNPFYQCYAAAVLAAGAEPVFVPATAETKFLPDYAGLSPDILARTVAAFICSPSNPEGACASEPYWRTLFATADKYDFTVFADECYADIWFEKQPVSALTARFAMSGDFSRLLTFHSLSKRSGLPGLRSGIVAGDPALMGKFRALRNYAGPQVPMPILAASAAAWNDEEHVEENRAMYVERLNWAERYLGNTLPVRRPEGGFFLWLDVGNGEAAALKLW